MEGGKNGHFSILHLPSSLRVRRGKFKVSYASILTCRSDNRPETDFTGAVAVEVATLPKASRDITLARHARPTEALRRARGTTPP